MLQCQEYDSGIQCPNQSIHSSSRCALHQPSHDRSAGTPNYDEPPPMQDLHDVVDYVADPDPGFCHAQTRLGKQCLAHKRKGRPYCISHDPAFRRQHLINSREGGLNSQRRREGIATLFDVDVVDLRTRGDIQALIDAVLRLELSGKVPASRTKNLARLISLAVRNFGSIPRADRRGGEICVHDPGYYDTRNALDLEIDDIAASLRQAETSQDDREIEKQRRLLQTKSELRPRPRSARENLLNTLSNIATRP